MLNPVRLCLTLHNHQPVGNFDHVFEQAYVDSYLPFLNVFDDFKDLRISLHTSGPLMEWLDAEHPDYLDRLAEHVATGRIEVIGGAFYEPILTMIPTWDRVGQISAYSDWLENRLGGRIRGMWMPERVWEQGLAAQMSDAGIEFTILDDFHFRNAGLSDDALHGYYVTEDQGKLVSIFPGSERMRYLVPFQDPQETENYLRSIGERHENAVVVFGDDGEKFGTWPDTKEHVYDNGWLRQFFEMLSRNQDWIDTTTLSDAIDSVGPIGKIYLPEGSYREMTEWALPAEQQVSYEDITCEFHDDPRWQRIQRFVRGGYWRNFKVKYPETDEMYTRMMGVSQRLIDAANQGCNSKDLEAARRELYRGQCNCSYWHGAFGGVYLPHLRNAVFQHLIKADSILNAAMGRDENWLSIEAADLDFDGRDEVRLENHLLSCFVRPFNGGQLYELDMHTICHNLLATLARRPEAYHRKVLTGPSNNDGVASIHDRVVFKQEGLEQRLQYDRQLRKSLIDRFYDDNVNGASVERGEANELGSFSTTPYEAVVRRSSDRSQVMLTGHSTVAGHELKITKGITLEPNSSTLDIAYQIENLPQDREFHFAVEFNFAGLPGGADDRFFSDQNGKRLGHLGERLDIEKTAGLLLTDQWLNVQVELKTDQLGGMWAFPIETVSQSEGGFEMVHQSVVVQPHWSIRGDANGQWSVRISLAANSQTKEQLNQAANLHVMG